jgi:hypothetical protein
MLSKNQHLSPGLSNFINATIHVRMQIVGLHSVRNLGIILGPLPNLADGMTGVEYHIVLDSLEFGKHMLQGIPAVKFLCQETGVLLRGETEEVDPFPGSDEAEALIPGVH